MITPTVLRFQYIPPQTNNQDILQCLIGVLMIKLNNFPQRQSLRVILNIPGFILNPYILSLTGSAITRGRIRSLHFKLRVVITLYVLGFSHTASRCWCLFVAHCSLVSQRSSDEVWIRLSTSLQWKTLWGVNALYYTNRKLWCSINYYKAPTSKGRPRVR